METALEKLVKVLELERQGGHRNHAVVGGVQRYIPVWIEQARAQADAEAEKALVEQVGELLTDYGQLAGPAARAKLVDAVQERLERAIAVRSAPPDPVEQATEPHLPSAETKAPARPIGPAPAPPDQAATMPAQPRETGRPVEAARHPDPPPSQVDHDAPSGLDAPITTLRGVGPRTAEQLQKLGLNTIGDMLAFYPRRYVDYSALKPISRLEYGEQVTIIGTVWETSVPRAKSRRKIVRSIIGDGTGTIECTWFNQPWLANKLKAGTAMMISGKVDRYLGRLTFQSPEWELVDKEQLHTGRIVPIYPLTAGLGAKNLRSQQKRTVDYWARRTPDPLSEEIRERQGLTSLENALLQIHFPDSWDHLQAARCRLVFDEFLIMQLGLLRLRRKWQAEPGLPIQAEDEWLKALLGELPFQLTSAQQRALADVLIDMAGRVPMNRLMQGDVGSGKTVVAAVAMAVAVRSGAQAALMAPTEILAEQHARNIGRLMDSRDGRPRIRLLTGSLSAADKQAIYDELAAGTADVVIGTHALIQAGVSFENLGLVIVDEQHRFGVEQRSELRQKGHNPHVLVMTATPIPRTLALTLYGDLDVSVIDEMPPGRQVIVTRRLEPAARERAYRFIRSQVDQGRQAFIICPLVEALEKSEAKAATVEHRRLQESVFPDLKVGLLHGRMKGEKKEAVMQSFCRGEVHVLVTTSVVEVGIDVPNASVMLVEGANRFGLAQLHQFRGRVGRGEHESYCLLLADTTTPEAEARLTALEATNDGFVLAEKDLELRGPGEFFGTRQSGLPDLKLAKVSDVRTLEQARKEAQELFAQDPLLDDPEHRVLASKVDAFWSGRGEMT